MQTVIILIYLGEIKKGYMFAMKEHMKKTHKIPLSFVQGHNQFKDYAQIFDKICKFLKVPQKFII